MVDRQNGGLGGDATLASLAAAVPDDPWAGRAWWAQHADAALRVLAASPADPAAWAVLFERAALWAVRREGGRTVLVEPLAAALEAHEGAVGEALGEPTQLRLEWLRTLLHQAQGDAVAAALALDPLLELQGAILDPRHPHVLATRHERARCWAVCGRDAQALAEIDGVIAGWAARGEATTVDALRARVDRGWIGRSAGPPADLVPTTLEAQRALLDHPACGPDHPDAWNTDTVVAMVLHQAGRLEEAHAAIDRAEARQRAELGPLHPHTLLTASIRVDLLRREDREEEAAEVLAAVATGRAREDVYGPRHPYTVIARRNAATLLEGRCRFVEALALREAVVDALADGAASTPEDARTVRRELAALQLQAGMELPDPALVEASRATLAALEAELRADGTADAAALVDVASRRRLAEDVQQVATEGAFGEEALAAHRAVAEEAVALLGPTHERSLSALGVLAVRLANLGHHDEAEATFARVLAGKEASLGPDDVETRATQVAMAQLALDRGQADRAEALARRALADRAGGGLPPGAAGAMATLASALLVRGRAGAAEDIARRGLALTPLQAHDRAVLRVRLGVALGTLGRAGEAVPELQAAVDFLARSLGPEAATTRDAQAYLDAAEAAVEAGAAARVPTPPPSRGRQAMARGLAGGILVQLVLLAVVIWAVARCTAGP